MSLMPKGETTSSDGGKGRLCDNLQLSARGMTDKGVAMPHLLLPILLTECRPDDLMSSAQGKWIRTFFLT